MSPEATTPRSSLSAGAPQPGLVQVMLPHALPRPRRTPSSFQTNEIVLHFRRPRLLRCGSANPVAGRGSLSHVGAGHQGLPVCPSHPETLVHLCDQVEVSEYKMLLYIIVINTSCHYLTPACGCLSVVVPCAQWRGSPGALPGAPWGGGVRLGGPGLGSPALGSSGWRSPSRGGFCELRAACWSVVLGAEGRHPGAGGEGTSCYCI